MNFIVQIVGFVSFTIVLILGVGFIRLSFDPIFQGERAEHLIFEGVILFVLSMCAIKYWFSESK